MKFFYFILAVFLITSCTKTNSGKNYTKVQIDSLSQAFQTFSQNKNTEFKTTDWSPLTEQDKAYFEALDYFPYDVSFRFEGPIILNTVQDSITILGTRDGDVRPALKYGYFEFTRNGKNYKLDVIKILPKNPSGQSHLFLGFWDETSGEETYGGGRYVEPEPAGENNYIIDFNYAYNPYCAYSNRYSCAIPPLTNRLDLKLTCGEKKYKEH
jgi:uncharacterized protein (DUF1684 family)